MIKLGATSGTKRTYNLLESRNGLAYSRSNANPFAAQVNTRSEFESFSSFNDWLLDNWQGGVGQEIGEGGFLYAHADTRFPHDLFLGMALTVPDYNESPNGGWDYADTDITVDGSTITKAANGLQVGGTPIDMFAAWVYLDGTDGDTITVEVYDAALSSTVSSGTGTLYKYRPGPTWVRVDMDGTQLTADTQYYLAVSGGSSITLPGVTPVTPPGSGQQTAYTYNGSTWSANDEGFMFLVKIFNATATLTTEANTETEITTEDGDTLETLQTDDDITDIEICIGIVYIAVGSVLYSWDESAKSLSQINIFSQPILDLQTWQDELYVALDGAVFNTYDPAADSISATSDNANLFAVWQGYIWRAYENDVWYSSDGSTWTGPIQIGPDGYTVNGLAGLGDVDMYACTDDALYRIGTGDFVYGITQWPAIDSNNGRGMVHWLGSLHIPVYNEVMHFNEAGQIQAVGLKRGEGLPEDIQGTIDSLLPNPYFLLAGIEPTSTSQGYSPTVWAKGSEGWHGIIKMPSDIGVGGMKLDAKNNYIWVGTKEGVILRAAYPPSIVNPLKDNNANLLFDRYSWIEFDRFYGGTRRLNKDWESVTLFGEDFATADDGEVLVYWKDEESTDWELLGTSTGDGSELRWDDRSTRPAGKWLQLGLLLSTSNESVSPVIEAINVKFLPIVVDRYGWDITVPISGNQQLTDGTTISYTAAQMKTHLESLIAQVPPIVFEDLDGTEYECWIKDHNMQVQEYEYYNSAAQIKWNLRLSLEMVLDG